MPIALNAVEADSRVPHGRFVFADADFKQSLNDLEQALQDLRCCEVLFHLLFTEAVARFFEFFANVWPVPGLWVLQP